jgi:hypothetical protein
MAWLDHLRQDPLPWLLSTDSPAVRAATLRRLLDAPADSAEVSAARTAAMVTDPIATILAAQDPAGWWVRPGPGYAPKYQGTVWQLLILDQLGADPEHPQVARACDYVLAWAHCPVSGGFAASWVAKEAPPPASATLHCLNGNLVRALIGLGRIDDPRVQAAIEWAARTITGEGVDRWYASGTCGPGFACAANEQQPCAWGALKELAGLARVPEHQRTPLVQAAIGAGTAFLFSRDPADADYPMGWGNTRPNGSWWKPGFPLAYVSDVLEILEVLAELGHARDPRLTRALTWLEARQDAQGRWVNGHAWAGKTWIDIDRQGQASRWVTLRACAVLRAAYG